GNAFVVAIGLVVLAFCVLILFVVVPGLEKMFRAPEQEESPARPPSHQTYLHLDDGDRSERELPASLDRVPEPEIEEAKQYMEAVWAAYGDVLIEQDDDDGAVAWLIDGELAVSVDGVEVGRVFPEELVGEMCLFEEGGRGAEVRAVMPSRLLVIERSGYEALARAGSQVAKVLEQVAVHGTGRKLRATERRLAGESAMSSRVGMRDADAQGVATRLGEFAAALRPLPADPHPQSAVEVLAQTPVFGHMPQVFLQYLAEKMELRDYGPGKALKVQGDPGDEMFVLAAGRVDLFLATAKKPELTLLDDLHSGDVFGLTSLFGGGARSASAVALGPVTTLVLDARLANALMDTDKPIGQAFRIAMVRALMSSLREANSHLSGQHAGASQAENIHHARAVILARRRER
ncbi:MAG: cyclic nucleotide-binding domain-containing protein, partial [Proteobacteria bacterium]|nr:cyclic nucleotide-binding domain-containing protein [Pseudomonadota bacterium]